MTYVYRPDPDNPEAYGVCAHSMRHYPRPQLVRQLEQVGDRLVWTGAYVHPNHIDKPATQLREGRLPVDPEPVLIPRPEPYTQGQDFILLGTIATSSELTHGSEAYQLDTGRTDHATLVWQ